jgi:ArsR family transcriptional regulator, arsenate/arsenite/antimonite-responsive transcriptional repressor
LARHFDDCRGVADAGRLARIFKALANPNRLRIYAEILKNEEARLDVGCGCHLADVVRSLRSLRIGSPTISHHVKELVNAELITAERQGKFLVCRINAKTRDLARAMFA